ncbi:hypothetical protein [Streptomyces abikoensis]|uniref:Uncharacterized protein n=1 Tax=Streptomyces abikoensis TaxID=97398 RepID=A0ABW7TBB2_9ACTN
MSDFPAVVSRDSYARALQAKGIPGSEATNRTLLLDLLPLPPIGTNSKRLATVMGIRSYITNPAHRSIPGKLVHEWRVALDQHYRRLPPEAVRALRWPGTWLDHQMHLGRFLRII